MPRPSPVRHPIRDARKLLKLTQPQFAKLVGVTAVSIRKIEGGSLKLSSNLASRITAATGLSGEELMKGSKGKTITTSGKAFSPDSYKAWIEEWRTADSAAAVEKFVNTLESLMRVVCLAASQSHQPKLRGVYTALVNAVGTIISEFSLKAAIKSLLVEKTTEAESTRVAKLIKKVAKLDSGPPGQTNPRSRVQGWRVNFTLLKLLNASPDFASAIGVELSPEDERLMLATSALLHSHVNPSSSVTNET